MSEGPRTAILAAVTEALAGAQRPDLPKPVPIFDDIAPFDPDVHARRFRDELAALHGETIFVPEPSALAAAVARLFDERTLGSAAVHNRPQATAALAALSGERYFLAPGASKERIARADCSIIAADALLADTGSVVVSFASYGERLLPYLPPTCIVVADARQLHWHMDDDALGSLAAAARNGRGETVIISGPSRTADIEKTLVLGAHGPHDLIVFIANAHEPLGG
jgi:L-lactate utilization protein LutC